MNIIKNVKSNLFDIRNTHNNYIKNTSRQDVLFLKYVSWISDAYLTYLLFASGTHAYRVRNQEPTSIRSQTGINRCLDKNNTELNMIPTFDFKFS